MFGVLVVVFFLCVLWVFLFVCLVCGVLGFFGFGWFWFFVGVFFGFLGGVFLEDQFCWILAEECPEKIAALFT